MIARVWGGAGADAEWTDVPVTPLTTCRDLVDCCRDPGDEPCTLVEVSMGHERALSDSERPLEVLQQWRGRGPVRLVLRYTLDHDHDREHDLDLDNQRRLSPHTALPPQEGVQPSRNGMKEPGPFADTVSTAARMSPVIPTTALHSSGLPRHVTQVVSSLMEEDGRRMLLRTKAELS
ncbi:apoptosis-stimulating of p53 protein 2-like [Schistocerca americana]|uniref:apoptosis-stimulating of p53 protein 2-like n=1 Tax=Schistocerca americana TaxID=7009 RepID=UPI001F4FE8DA|nr:apoptosis-stimulating of p53 protein 2-like [Schistocerca americana]